jgi:hypothetical protein
MLRFTSTNKHADRQTGKQDDRDTQSQTQQPQQLIICNAAVTASPKGKNKQPGKHIDSNSLSLFATLPLA